jgi:hypothetical protein
MSRLAAAVPPVVSGGTVAVPAGAPRVIEGIAIVDGRFACSACGTVLGDGGDTYRLGCARLDVSLDSISSLYVSPVVETGTEYIARTYLCPGCGLALDAHLCRPSDVPYRDVCLL